MLDNRQFDLWAGSYERSVRDSDRQDAYPFAGYGRVMNLIFGEIMAARSGRVLDVGIGTGLLASRLDEAGFSVTGIDFSEEMIRTALKRLPRARLIRHDLTAGFPEALQNDAFDFITATYSLHHLTGRAQTDLIAALLAHLSENGRLFIGDVAFADRTALEKCRADSGREWDDEECYFCFDELKTRFPDAVFTPCSHCSGVITLRRSAL